MGNLNNKITFNYDGKSLLETIFSGKTLSEIKSMSKEERQQLITPKTSKPQSTEVPKFSARTNFDFK